MFFSPSENTWVSEVETFSKKKYLRDKLKKKSQRCKLLPCFAGVNCLFVLAYFLRRVNVKKYLLFLRLTGVKSFSRISRFFFGVLVASKLFREKKKNSRKADKKPKVHQIGWVRTMQTFPKNKKYGTFGGTFDKKFA